jgi:ketosteroid isomerase-like protein
MSQENVETVRGIYAEWEKGNFQAALPALDREITFEVWMPDSNELDVRHGLNRLEDGTGRRSGVEVDSPGFSVWTFRAGKVVRLLVHYDRAAALKATGLLE